MKSLSIIDRLALVFNKPRSKKRILNNIELIALDDEKHLCSLKFSYPGNVQFHKLTIDEAKCLADNLAEMVEQNV